MKKLLNEEKTNKIDFIILGIIVVIYSILSFYRLGNIKSPNTFISYNKGEELNIYLNQEDDIIRMKSFNGHNNSHYEVWISKDKENYEKVTEIIGNGAFSWNNDRILTKGKYLKLVFLNDSTLGELSIYNNYKNKINISTSKELIDEQELIPDQISNLNSTYFDEIYFARTAYEYTKGLNTYEWTHPPLGKLIQAIPIFITKNMSPFNYRIMGNIAGIMMLIVIYFLTKEILKKRKYAIAATVMMMFDTFHFVQTRMGTIDSHLVLFIMISAYYMIKYYNHNKNSHLILSSIFFTLAICTKWTGFYLGIALTIIYLIIMLKDKKNIINYIIKGFSLFIIIPTFIYFSIYYLFPNNLYKTNNIKNIISEQQKMYEYHSRLKATHPFTSKWYEWPISYKPVWYYTESRDNNKKETITGVGNIIIWWFGILSTLYITIKAILKKDKNSIILLIFILSLWLPYAFINRIMFQYHYFTTIPFVILANTYLLKDISEKKHIKYLIPTYLLAVILFFVIYYPVISGIPVDSNYIDRLKLLSTWIF